MPCSRWEVAPHVEKCWKLARVRVNVTPKHPNPSNIWRFDIAMSIASSENEDCHEDRGPNQLDPCDCCRRQPWEGGGPGGAYHGTHICRSFTYLIMLPHIVVCLVSFTKSFKSAPLATMRYAITTLALRDTPASKQTLRT